MDHERHKAGYKFNNFTGIPLKFCLTDDELDENLLLPSEKQ
jgi:hypothetical protein